MPQKLPPENTRYIQPLFTVDPADSEVLIVARRLKSGGYTFHCRQVTLHPFRIRSWQLGQEPAGTPHTRSPWAAALWASSLFSIDTECIAALDSAPAARHQQ